MAWATSLRHHRSTWAYAHKPSFSIIFNISHSSSQADREIKSESIGQSAHHVPAYHLLHLPDYRCRHQSWRRQQLHGLFLSQSYRHLYSSLTIIVIGVWRAPSFHACLYRRARSEWQGKQYGEYIAKRPTTTPIPLGTPYRRVSSKKGNELRECLGIALH